MSREIDGIIFDYPNSSKSAIWNRFWRKNITNKKIKFIYQLYIYRAAICMHGRDAGTVWLSKMIRILDSSSMFIPSPFFPFRRFTEFVGEWSSRLQCRRPHLSGTSATCYSRKRNTSCWAAVIMRNSLLYTVCYICSVSNLEKPQLEQ